MADKTKLSESRDRLEEEIGRLEDVSSSAVRTTLPKVKLEEITYAAPSDSELMLTAERELAEYRSDAENDIRRQSDSEKAELNSKRDAYVDGKRNSEAELEQQYTAAARAIDNDVVKRGLARSSIAAVERGQLEREYLSKNAEIAKQYGSTIAQLESDIASIDKKLQSALNDFNLTYAAKLTGKLNELKAEREKKIRDVTEYNNEVKSKQAKLDNDRLKLESDLYSAALSQEKQESALSGIPAERRDEIYRAVYKKMDEFLASLDPAAALVEIRNHSMYRQHLSNYYYNRLYDKYGREVL